MRVCACVCGQPDLLHLCTKLMRRGPDRLRIVTLPLSDDCELVFVGSLLSLRGEPTPMPLVDDDGNILVFNGQVRIPVARRCLLFLVVLRGSLKWRQWCVCVCLSRLMLMLMRVWIRR